MSNTASLIFERLRAGGLSPQAAAGLVGNIGMESSFNTGARNAGDGRDGSDSVGLSQWNGPRAQALKALAAERGVDWRDPGLQADFIVQELNTTEKRAKEALMSAADPQAAGAAAIGYFRPAGFTWQNPLGGHNADKRVAEAVRYAGEFGGLPAQTGVAATNTPMQMPDLSPVAPIPAPEPIQAADTTLADALKAFSSAFAQPQAQKQPAPVQKPTMPLLRPQAKPVVVAERGNSTPKKADLASIFGA